MRSYFRKLQVSVMFSGPYSYAAAPIELLFGALKRGELNPQRESTGKGNRQATVESIAGSSRVNRVYCGGGYRAAAVRRRPPGTLGTEGQYHGTYATGQQDPRRAIC